MNRLNLKTKWYACAFLLGICSILHSQTSEIIYKDGQGRLNYFSDEEDNRIPDFSFAGYKAGEANIPSVPVEITISPISGDNTAHIQQAIDQIEAMPLINGMRGAVLLQSGTYRVDGSINIRESGVILRGQGNGTNPASNTILFSPKKNSFNTTSVIRIRGGAASGRFRDANDVVPNTVSNITNEFLPVNSRSFEVSNASLYTVGDIICIRREPENGWLDMIDGGGPGTDAPWSTADDLEMVYPRKIIAINGSKVILDQPIYEHIFGNGATTTTMYTLNMAEGRFLNNVGIEKLRITAERDDSDSHFNAKNCVDFNAAWNCWATDVITENFWAAGFHIATSNYITIERCKALTPSSAIEGSRRYNFNMHFGATNVLVKDCDATEGRHAYVSNGTTFVSGIVFTNCTSNGTHSSIEGHRRWTQAILYDKLTITNSNTLGNTPTTSTAGRVLGLYNRGSFGTSHGWSASHSVVWNSSSTDYNNTRFVVQKPPTSQNYALFCDATVTGVDYFYGDIPGYFEGTRSTPPFPSLYEAQLTDRLTFGVLPDPPAKVNASVDLNANELMVSWLDNSGEEDGYVIEISTDGGSTYNTLANLSANTNHYSMSLANTTYDFFNADFQIYSTKGANKSSRLKFALPKSTTNIFNLIDDAYTESGTSVDTNFGSIDNILIKSVSGMGDGTRNGYMKFDLTDILNNNLLEEVSRVYLNFNVYYSNKTMDFNVYKVLDDSWSENTITYNNAPPFSDVVASFSTNGSVGGAYSLDVTDYVKNSINSGDAMISFAIHDDDDENGHIRIYSKENTSGDIPNLSVETVRKNRDNEDAYVWGGSHANSNYGLSTSLLSKKHDNEEFLRVAFLKFDLSEISENVNFAKIKMKVKSADTGAETSMYFVDNDTWTETTITWNNQPSQGVLISTQAVPAVGEWIEFDVTSVLNQELAEDGILSVKISQPGNDAAATYHSKEATTAEDRPQLVADDFEITLTNQNSESNGDLESAQKSLKLYPNPSNNIINIEYFRPIKNVAILSFNGTKIINKNIEDQKNRLSLDVKPLSQGIYLLTLEDDIGNRINKKIIKY